MCGPVLKTQRMKRWLGLLILAPALARATEEGFSLIRCNEVFAQVVRGFTEDAEMRRFAAHAQTALRRAGVITQSEAPFSILALGIGHSAEGLYLAYNLAMRGLSEVRIDHFDINGFAVQMSQQHAQGVAAKVPLPANYQLHFHHRDAAHPDSYVDLPRRYRLVIIRRPNVLEMGQWSPTGRPQWRDMIHRGLERLENSDLLLMTFYLNHERNAVIRFLQESEITEHYSWELLNLQDNGEGFDHVGLLIGRAPQ